MDLTHVHSQLIMSLREFLWSKVLRRMSCTDTNELKLGTENLQKSFNSSQNKTLVSDLSCQSSEAGFAPSDM